MKQYIGISRDHSGSMAYLAKNAMKDYNSNIEGIKEGSNENGIDTVVSVVECGIGYGAINRFAVTNSSVNSLKPLTTYETTGNRTPLFDSVGLLVEQLKKVPDSEDPSVSFLVMVITDGQDNSSVKFSGESLGREIRKLQGTDKWTFTFRVPKGYKENLVRLGIPEWNILEWEQTSAGFERATVQTRAAVKSYYSARATGQTATTRFYADLDNVPMYKIKEELDDISKEARFFEVKRTSSIRDFIEYKVGSYELGKSFYQLTKPEKLQGNKLIAIRAKSTGKVYAGDAARNLMNLPVGGEIKLYPKNSLDFDIFVQSTSTNRKLLPRTEVLYWRNA